MTKYRTSPAETALIVEGLDALARENARLAEDARRLGYPEQAAGFRRKAVEAGALASLAKSVRIERLTVRY
jgi:hypothetical protein